mmetsp:Transcript_6633/g.11561  ORF Transcript_6633/g.11561 Transcript_6633/m.11561 type:complete len:267 (-) Transcript_6633:94-894(-)
MGPEAFLAGLSEAIMLKLGSSVDDVLWLAPFLTSNVTRAMRIQNSLIYVGVCMCQTVAAMLIAYSGEEVVEKITNQSKHAWSADKILTVGAGTLMALYAMKLTYEYIQELKEQREEAEQEEMNTIELGRGSEKKALTSGSDLESTDTSSSGVETPQDVAGKSRQWTLFVITVIGSMDDLTLFVPMLLGKGLHGVELMLGALIAATAIVFLCVFVGLCKPIADFLSSIPLALIVSAFAVLLLVKGLTMSDEVASTTATTTLLSAVGI